VAVFTCLTISGALTQSSLASGGHVDVGFALLDGKLVTAGGDFTEVELLARQSIYEFELEREGTGVPFTAGDPGHVALSQANLDLTGNLGDTDGATALPGDRELSWSFRPFTIDSQTRNIFYWDATGPLALTPVDGDIELKWTQKVSPFASTTITGDDDSVVSGLVIDVTDDAVGFVGEVHQHVDSELGHATDDDLVPDGIYVISVDYTLEGVGTADPVYHILPALQAEDFLVLTPAEEARIEEIELGVGAVEVFIEENLLGSGSGNASAAPEPSSALLVILGVLGSAAFGRSRRRTRS